MVEIIGLVLASLVLITLSMLFSISESSFLGMNRLRLRILVKKGNRRAIRVMKLLAEKERLINTLLVANDLVNIMLSSLITAVAMGLFGNSGVGLATFVVTILLLVFGEITPKTISTRNPDKIAYSLSFFVKIVVVVMKPFVAVFTFVSQSVLKLRGIDVGKPKQSYTEEDIKSFIDVGKETGVLEVGEGNMMNRVFKFTDLEASSIMIPRTSIAAISERATWSEVIELAQRTRYSRFPVYRKNLDDIVGVLYLKDLLKVMRDNGENNLEKGLALNKLMRPPLFIPGSKKMSSIQQMMKENRQSIAIVIDEYAGTDGILTQSDIYRQIFGTSENNLPWRDNGSVIDLKGHKNFIVDGSVSLVDFNEICNIKLESEINETLGGWITEKLDRIAIPGDVVHFDGVKMEVESVAKRCIKNVHVEIEGEDAVVVKENNKDEYLVQGNVVVEESDAELPSVEGSFLADTKEGGKK